MHSFISPRLAEKAYAGIWGFIVGDALGVPYEFLTREELKAAPAMGMTGWGTHHQPPGTWSDDTSMILCVLENNFQSGGTEELARLFLKWYEEGYHTPYGEVFDIGTTTRQAMERLKSGVPARQAGLIEERSAGNGSLMRSLPYAFVEEFALGGFQMVVHNQITHRVTLCHECCFFFIRMVRLLAEGYTKEEAVKGAGSYLRMGWRITDYDEENVGHRKLFGRLFQPKFRELPEESINSSGYVIETLEAAIWCFMNGYDYSTCVLKAVNLGGDTDTIAALTGGLAGIYYGISVIPQDWRNAILGKEILENKINIWLGSMDGRE